MKQYSNKKTPGILPRACFIIHSKPNTDISSYLFLFHKSSFEVFLPDNSRSFLYPNLLENACILPSEFRISWTTSFGVLEILFAFQPFGQALDRLVNVS